MGRDSVPNFSRISTSLQSPWVNNAKQVSSSVRSYYLILSSINAKSRVLAIGGDNQSGPHMNSAVVARDIASFLDAYANSTYSAGVANSILLNYWGFSYGVNHLSSPSAIKRTNFTRHILDKSLQNYSLTELAEWFSMQ